MKINDIVLYCVAFLVSMVGFNKEIAPFGLAIFAAACSNKIPVGILGVAVLIGTAIGFGISGVLTFLLSSLLFIVMILIFRPKIQEPDKNEKQKLGIYVAISAFAVQASKMFFGVFLVYDLISSIAMGIITYIFYKIFANSIIVITEYGNKKAFAIEEVMGASLIISIALCAFSKLHIFGLSITNIFSVMLVLFLGWKNGMLVGGTAGITIGMVLGIINSTSPILVASYAISGMIAGILNKLGKIGVIIGFCVGNAILTYVTNGNTVPIITIREILIASLGLLVIPKEVNIDITEIINTTKCLPTTAGVIEEKKKTASKLNSVSETILQMARSYNESAKDTLDESIEDESKKTFKDEVMNNLDDIQDNPLYEDILLNDEEILNRCYDILEEKNEINQDELIRILENVNDYKMVKDNIFEMLEPIIKIINSTYRINKLNTLWKHKEANNKQVLATLIDIPFSISPVIAGLAFLMTFGRLGWAGKYIEKINEALGTDIKIVFAIPGVILATICVTFPFVSREIIPVLNAQGKEEEEAATLMGASGFRIFRKITLPHMKWALLYGIILCTARALGEFGAVNALSKTRGETFTLPLEIDALYLSGSADSITAAFAVSSVLVIIAVLVLVLRNFVEYKSKKKGKV